MDSEINSPLIKSTVPEMPLMRPAKRKLWQMIAAVLGDPIMRAVGPKNVADQQDDEERAPAEGDLSDLYPPDV